MLMRFCKNISLFLAALFFMVVFVTPYARADGAASSTLPIRLVVTEDNPPLVYLNNSGEVTGTAANRVQTVLKSLNQTSRIQVLLWSRAYEVARQNKNVLIFPIARSPERERQFKFAGVIDKMESYFYKLKSSDIPKIKSLADAKKYKICVVRQDIRQQYLKEQGFTNLVEAYDLRQSMDDFVSGQCHLGAFSTSAFAVQEDNLFITRNQLSNVEQAYPITGIDGRLYMAFSADTSDALVEAVRAAAAKVYAQD